MFLLLQICKLQSFCICEADASHAYTAKAKLALSLDKDDFVVNGYPVDARKHPFKPSAKGKERVPVEEDAEEEFQEMEEDEEVGAQDVPMYHDDIRDDPLWVPTTENVAGVSGVSPMRPCNLFSGEAVPSSSHQLPPHSDDVLDLSDSDESDEDDDDGEELLPRRGVGSPPSKRQRMNMVNPSPAESTSPPSSVDYARQVQLLELRLAEQERKFAQEKADQQALFSLLESERQAREAEEERRRNLRQEELLEKQRLMMEQNQQLLLTNLLSKIGIVLPSSAPVFAVPTPAKSAPPLPVVLNTPEVISAPAERPWDAPSADVASLSPTRKIVEELAAESTEQQTAIPSMSSAPVIDLGVDSMRLRVISPQVSVQAPSMPAEMQVDAEPEIAQSAAPSSPSNSSGCPSY
ncbi:hypothetical protein AVDCRST_MAG81-4658 [uncultured Synechococcales cyanobacterium]|uniref:Uncharacterized protein n=1 Tax=uncultured Synechococcales cyanobacterium TaxID=1936017 RepID=A0A6J4VXN9_9CYAN|nr:hypothetical protein AVDCRST_MAG81-4658 [uncultured Synechococcales cyanobacterium]